MATFDNTIPLGYSTILTPKAGKTPIQFDDNSFDIHSYSEGDIYTGKIVCTLLDLTQRDAVMAFYISNKDLTFQFLNPHDGEVYDLDFIDPGPGPFIASEYVPPRWNITLNVMGVRV